MHFWNISRDGNRKTCDKFVAKLLMTNKFSPSLSHSVLIQSKKVSNKLCRELVPINVFHWRLFRVSFYSEMSVTVFFLFFRYTYSSFYNLKWTTELQSVWLPKIMAAVISLVLLEIPISLSLSSSSISNMETHFIDKKSRLTGLFYVRRRKSQQIKNK